MKYTYEEVAKAMEIADEKIHDILKSAFKQLNAELKRIENGFDKVCYKFNNEEEKAKLIEMYENVKSRRDSSEYSEYIDMQYEIDGEFFYPNVWRLSEKFATDQRRKAMQNIVIEL